MKRLLICACGVILIAALAPAVHSEEELTCATIQDGTLTNSDGELLETGYDVWGYNYQVHIFNGTYCDAYRDAAWCQPWKDVELIMKWNDAWLSNEDCDGDGLLDRHHGYDSYIGCGAWLTNHQSGTYPDPAKPSKTCRWTYFVKIVAVPSDATLDGASCTGSNWLDGSGEVIGECIWGSFAVIQRKFQDPCDKDSKENYKGLRPGLGNWEDDPT